jgi:hypothetical protein
MPDHVRVHDPGGAYEMGIYYVRALDWSIATNDPALIRRISLTSCRACKRVIQQLDRNRKDHATLIGGRVHLLSGTLVSGSFTVASDYVVQVRVHEDAERISRSPSASPSKVSDAEDSTSLVFVDWTAGGWKVREVGARS